MIDFNPYAEQLIDDPYPMYRTLREEAPVFRHPELGFVALSRYDDVKTALLRPGPFSSRRSLASDAADPAAAIPMMVILDAPRHDELRALVNRAFTPRRIADLEVRIRAITVDLIECFADSGHCDLWEELAAPLPTIVIAELLGVAASEREMFKEKSTVIVSGVGPGREPGQEVAAAGQELAAYLASAFAEKRKQPADDLMTALLAAEIDGQRLTEAELIGFALLLLIAGNETTTNLISNSALLFAQHPRELAEVAEQPTKIERAIEECLRLDPPIQGLERIATEDVTIRSETLLKGTKVFLLIASANRDPRQFVEPDRFDINRKPNLHLSFGLGAHFCLGASLARLEARVAWEEMLRRIPSFHVSSPVERLRSGVFRGPLGVPIEFERR